MPFHQAKQIPAPKIETGKMLSVLADGFGILSEHSLDHSISRRLADVQLLGDLRVTEPCIVINCGVHIQAGI
jgi:hypothetical protein